ncbi:conjugal transfer nickase/helicase domain-containing protein [Legionella impletisoli]|uniref:Helicase n=1 Tax=Legionella impletisoli TaxID=343510 RepID=A0A917NBM8_9GAMM|nr:TraI domain-containing protein [Legionella impletisoli]GGI84955.1 helicase [Legionella impletisoli]
MFHRNGRKDKPSKGKPLKDMLVVQTPEELLKQDKRQHLLSLIQGALELSESRYETMCLALVHNLINHCQSLPETANSYYSLPGGVLDYALNRTEAAMNLFREYIILEGELSEEQKLWLYALFSAGILKGIGKLQIDYQVDLFDINGQSNKVWNPLLESICSAGSYYHYQMLSEEDDDLRCRLNLLLAKMLMPTTGFSWIASNPEVLKVWLALLNEDWQSAGTLGALLVRADAIAIQRFIVDFMALTALGKGARGGRMSTFVDTSPASLVERERATGVHFIQWLIEALEKGELMINKAPLFMVPGGMLMSSDLYKLFVREHPEYKNWQAVQNGLLALQLHEVGPDGVVTSRFEQAHTQQMVSGVVLENYAVVLPERVKYHHLNTGKVSELSAVEVINKAQFNQHFNQQLVGVSETALQHLLANGQWVKAGDTMNTLQAGSKFRG